MNTMNYLNRALFVLVILSAVEGSTKNAVAQVSKTGVKDASTPLSRTDTIYRGIKWTEGLTWSQIKQKAEAENKFIFIDVYATWCGPCKQMDKDIYPLPQVGKLYNEKFIAIRVQADQNEKDNDFVKRWYVDAANIRQIFNAKAFPTFLFISPDGKLIHRASGVFNEINFLGLANDALQEKGYGASVEKFKSGLYEHLDLKDLAMTAKYAGDDSLARLIATKYVEMTSIHELIRQENMVFVFSFGEEDKVWAKQVCLPKLQNLSVIQLGNPIAIRFLLFAAKNNTLASLATDYWVGSLTDKEIFTKENLAYLQSFVCNSSDKSFQLLKKHVPRTSKIMGEKNFGLRRIDEIIIKEEFYEPIYNPAVKLIKTSPKSNALTEPDWKKLQSTIIAKYGAACAKRLQFIPKISWYNTVGNKREYTKSLVAEMDRTQGWDLNGFALNNNSVEIFMYSTSKKELETAVNWMKKYFEKNPKEFETDGSGIDTYATLLYKVGRIKESIALEEKAVKIDPDEEINQNLINMKKGLPIWTKGYDIIKK